MRRPSPSQREKARVQKGEKRKEGEGLGHYTANCDLIGQLSLVPSPSDKYLLLKEYEVPASPIIIYLYC